MAGYRQNVNLKFNRMSPRAVLRILFVIFGGGRKFTAFATLNLRSAERLGLRFGRFAQNLFKFYFAQIRRFASNLSGQIKPVF